MRCLLLTLGVAGLVTGSASAQNLFSVAPNPSAFINGGSFSSNPVVATLYSGNNLRSAFPVAASYGYNYSYGNGFGYTIGTSFPNPDGWGMGLGGSYGYDFAGYAPWSGGFNSYGIGGFGGWGGFSSFSYNPYFAPYWPIWYPPNPFTSYSGFGLNLRPNNLANFPPYNEFESVGNYYYPPALRAPEPAVPGGAAQISIEVPNDADVTVQGYRPEQTGSSRVFTTPPLNGPGTYEVVVKTKDGERKFNVAVTPGNRASLLVLR